MSFEANDMNTIHLGNYEEFFILYMDNELSDAQVKMVDEFLAAHPDLKTEFEMLLSTKLPLEEFSFNKAGLMAADMKLTSVDEELLLYIDNELSTDDKKKIELELASNKDYGLQHQVLLQTKLDPEEKIVYPNKKELYRREERVVLIKVWMRVAAAVIIIAVGGILYFQNSSPSSTIPPQTTAGANKINQKKDQQKNDLPNEVPPSFEKAKKVEIAVNNSSKKEVKQDKSKEEKKIKVENPVQQNEIAYTPEEVKEDVTERPVVKNIEANLDNNIQENIASVNKDFVTSSLANRLDNSSGDDEKIDYASNNDRKGSIKGFLRKATRVIEKRTGIDPTNDGELLIGAVAINLK